MCTGQTFREGEKFNIWVLGGETSKYNGIGKTEEAPTEAPEARRRHRRHPLQTANLLQSRLKSTENPLQIDKLFKLILKATETEGGTGP